MRIGIVSDIHANLIALETVLEAMGPVDKLWCLGDVVGYGPSPNECIESLLARPDLEICLTGNHDWAALGRLDLNDFNPDARQAAIWTRQQLTKESERFLLERPGKVVYDEEFTLAHASPRHPIWEYITSPAIARINFLHFETPVCLVGHTHVPAMYSLDEQGAIHDEMLENGASVSVRDGRRFILNPGSVGQPRDSDPRAAYAVWDGDAGVIHFHRIAYDVAATQQRMAEFGLPIRLIMRLNYGW